MNIRVEATFKDSSELERVKAAGAEAIVFMQNHAKLDVDDVEAFLKALDATYEYIEDGCAGFSVPDSDIMIWVDIQDVVDEVTLKSWECTLCGATFVEHAVFGVDGRLDYVEESGEHESTCPVVKFR